MNLSLLIGLALVFLIATPSFSQQRAQEQQRMFEDQLQQQQREFERQIQQQRQNRLDEERERKERLQREQEQKDLADRAAQRELEQRRELGKRHIEGNGQ